MKLEYVDALKTAHEEIRELIQERARIDGRIAQLKLVCESLSRALGMDARPSPVEIAELANQVPADPGITAAIRRVLAGSKIPLSPPEIRAGLESLGVDMSGYANAAAVVHNTLARLERQREVIRVQNPAGQTVAYALASSNTIGDRLIAEGNRIVAGGVPNPLGKNLNEMLNTPQGKKK